MDPDVRIAHLAGRQLGLFTRRDARMAGFSDHQIKRRLALGRWEQRSRQVLALAGYERTWAQRCLAATMSHPAAALSHQTAAVQRGLDGFRPGHVHIAVPPCGAHDLAGVTVHRTRHHDFELVHGIRTTSFAQTMVQLAATADGAALMSALHSGVHQRPERIDQLRCRLGELRDRRMPGLGRLVELLDELDGQAPTASELERLLWRVLSAVPDLPPVVRQRAMPWSPERSTLVDGFVPAWSLVLEADGRSWHTRVADFERDRWRDAEAAAHGLHVMRFGWHQLDGDPEAVVDLVTRFGRRSVRRSA